jgi:DNA repair protein RadC
MKTQSTVCEIKVSYEPSLNLRTAPVIKTSDEAATLLRELFDPATIALREEFVILYLNKANRVLGSFRLSVGGIDSTVADIRIILALALKAAASGIILCHNHPSGNLTPSSADLGITAKVAAACRLIDIRLIDHIILAPGGEFCSIQDVQGIH